MPYREFHYRWEYDLQSSPEQLWPFVADTNRFNRDTGVPSLEIDGEQRPPSSGLRRRLRLSVFGVPIEWEEEPFEWIRPVRLSGTRRYIKGPVAELRVLVELLPRAVGGTKLTYQVWAKPKSPLGLLAIPIQIGMISARRFARAYEKYDELVANAEVLIPASARSEISAAVRSRLNLFREKLVEEGVSQPVAGQLVSFIENGDEMDLARIRPYALADSWHESRRALLEACFRATRIGLLDLQWDLLCPMCRGPQETRSSLQELNSNVHCEGCRIDFTVNFDRFVEITFTPNASIRKVDVETYCVSSPQRTPHVIAQQILKPQTERTLVLPVREGSYRLRVPQLRGEQSIRVIAGGPESAVATASVDGSSAEEIVLAPESALLLRNASDDEQLFRLEQMAWSDQAATAAEVTALQIFRDLFSSEALRPGEQISVGTLTVLFTDLRNSTRLYREIGDAPAFARVMNHFDVLKKTIADEDGALVKTIGDAVMAVFREPEAALRAMLKAQEILASPPDGSMPLTLKAGIHSGPCIAVTLNDRLDYFGSTVNMAARLEGLSTGNDVVISRAVYDDVEVRELVNGPDSSLSATRFEMDLKGFDEERFELWRVGRQEVAQMRDAASS
jgi:class 3 adenylate cyclase